MSSHEAKQMQKDLEKYVANIEPEPACFTTATTASRQNLPTL